ncbi:MAG: hypothetical protein ACO1RA_11665 [Planctomycetaceae bacterium]
MGVVIERVDDSKKDEDCHLVTVLHQDHRINAIILGPFDRVSSLVGTSVTAEFELTKIESAELDLPALDGASGIFQETPDTILIDGTVHLLTRADDHFTCIDIYIRNGADFFAISSEDVDSIPNDRESNSHSRARSRGVSNIHVE